MKIVIIGYPRSGKSKYLRGIHTEGFKVVKTEDYIDLPYKDQLYYIIDEVEGEENWIIEGIQGFRFLRKYAEKDRFDLRPDKIIWMKNIKGYNEEHKNMIKGLDKIMKDYLDLEPYLPKIKVIYSGL